MLLATLAMLQNHVTSHVIMTTTRKGDTRELLLLLHLLSFSIKNAATFGIKIIELISRYGIEYNKSATQVEDLTAFEEDMINLVHKIRFCKVKSHFQKQF